MTRMANLAEYLQGKRPGRFQPRAHYVADGDTLVFYFKDDESYAERVDELLTVYHSLKIREAAAFPARSPDDHKFWPPVARVDNVSGDRDPVCSCVGMENYSS